MSFANFEDLRTNVLALSNNIKMIEKNTKEMQDEIWRIKNQHWGEIVAFFQQLYILASDAGVTPAVLRVKIPIKNTLAFEQNYHFALSKNSSGQYEMGIYRTITGTNTSSLQFKRWIRLYTSYKQMTECLNEQEQEILEKIYDQWDLYKDQIQENFFDTISAILNQKIDTVAKKSLQITQKLKDTQAQNK